MKRLLSILMILALAAVLAGCGAWEDEEELVPMGRFVETAMQPPAGRDEMEGLLRRASDGRTYGLFVSHGEEPYYRLFFLESREWKAVENSPFESLPTPDYGAKSYEYIQDYDIAADGTPWILTSRHESGENYPADPDDFVSSNHAYRWGEGAWIEATPTEWAVSELYMTQLAALPDGGLLAGSSYRGAVQYDASGFRDCQYSGIGMFASTDEGFYQLRNDYGAILYFEYGNKIAKRVIPHPNGEALAGAGDYDALNSLRLAADPDGTLYLADHTGIYRFAKGDTVGEQILDGELVTLNEPAISFSSLWAVEGDFYLGCYNATGGIIEYLRYSYDPDAPAYPTNTLNVYSYSDSAVIRRAMTEFQRRYPDCRVKYRVGETEGGETAAFEDTVKLLNTELLSGQGPDLLLLDGLPIENYMENGVLADLTDVIAPMEEQGRLVSAVAETYLRDGKYYALPLRYSLPLFFLADGEAGGDMSLAGLAGLARSYRAPESENGSWTPVPFLLPGSYAERVSLFLPLCWDGLLAEGGKLDEAAVSGFLQDLRAVSKAAGDTSTPDKRRQLENGPGELGLYDEFNNDLMHVLRYYAYGEAGFPAFAALADDALELLNYDYLRAECGLRPESFGKAYLPSSVVGVNQKSGQKETAVEFVSLMLEPEVQKYPMDGGFPTLLAAREAQLAEVMERDSGVTTFSFSIGETELKIRIPPMTEAGMQIFTDLLDSVETSAALDASILTIFQEETADYLAGSRPLEETVAAVCAKVDLRLSE